MLKCGQQPGSAREWESVLSDIQCESSLVGTACSLTAHPPNIVRPNAHCLSISIFKTLVKCTSYPLDEVQVVHYGNSWLWFKEMTCEGFPDPWHTSDHNVSRRGFWSIQNDSVIGWRGAEISGFPPNLTSSPHPHCSLPKWYFQPFSEAGQH